MVVHQIISLKNEHIVAYDISGVFELEHRLMEAGDMMMLSGLDKN